MRPGMRLAIKFGIRFGILIAMLITLLDDEARAKTQPAWREWFTANIVKK
jgi:hypothetical protein